MGLTGLWKENLQSLFRVSRIAKLPLAAQLALLMRMLAVISSIYGFVAAYTLDGYLPWRIRFVRAVELTTLAHLGFWLACFDWRGWFRFIVVVLLVPSIVGVLFLWWYLGVPIAAWLGWRMVCLIRSGRREAYSVYRSPGSGLR